MCHRDIPDLEPIFNRIPILAGQRVEDFQVNRLSGFTNINIHLKNNDQNWVLRIPQSQSSQFINRNAETHNATIVEQLGLAPETIWSDDSGLSLTKTLKGTHSLTTNELMNGNVLNDVITMIKSVHQLDNHFHGTVNLEVLLTKYYRHLTDEQQQGIENQFQQALKLIRGSIQQDDLLVSSHNDLVLENILINQNRQIWFIDWEYSSIASPYWDLATLCNAVDFDEPQMQKVLDLYNTDSGFLKMSMLMNYRYVMNVLSKCWMTVINPDEK